MYHLFYYYDLFNWNEHNTPIEHNLWTTTKDARS